MGSPALQIVLLGPGKEQTLWCLSHLSFLVNYQRDRAKHCHDLFRVEGLPTENPRTRHSQEERTKLEGLTWRKNSPLACFLGPWYAIKKKKKHLLNAFKFFLHTMTHQTKVRLGNQDHQFLEIKHGWQTTKQWLPRSSPAEASPCLREEERLPAQAIWLTA